MLIYRLAFRASKTATKLLTNSLTAEVRKPQVLVRPTPFSSRRFATMSPALANPSQREPTSPPPASGIIDRDELDERPAKKLRLDNGLGGGEAVAFSGGGDAQPVTGSGAGPTSVGVDYRTGLHLAPMVRIGTLPTRLLSLEYGADLVWGPEIVDKAIIGSERIVDEKSGTISFVKKTKSIFECHPIEKSRLIYQIGSSDPELAVKAAKLVENDVRGVDLNCGCPKDFSLKGGMGAALLKEPDKLCNILTALKTSLSVPVSCKIRLLPTQEATLSLVRRVISTGISCLTVHCRTQEMRPNTPALLERLRDIVDLSKEMAKEAGKSEDESCPVVANGDCWGTADVEKIKNLTGVSAIMVARGAEANPSCFRPEGFLDHEKEIVPRYLRLAMATNNHWSNTKYILQCYDFVKHNTPQTGPPGNAKKYRAEMKTAVTRLKGYEGACEMFGVDHPQTKGEKVEDIVRVFADKISWKGSERVEGREVVRENGNPDFILTELVPLKEGLDGGPGLGDVPPAGPTSSEMPANGADHL